MRAADARAREDKRSPSEALVNDSCNLACGFILRKYRLKGRASFVCTYCFFCNVIVGLWGNLLGSYSFGFWNVMKDPY